jgi:hypothetical protein
LCQRLFLCMFAESEQFRAGTAELWCWVLKTWRFYELVCSNSALPPRVCNSLGSTLILRRFLQTYCSKRSGEHYIPSSVCRKNFEYQLIQTELKLGTKRSQPNKGTQVIYKFFGSCKPF